MKEYQRNLAMNLSGETPWQHMLEKTKKLVRAKKAKVTLGLVKL